MFDAYVQVQSGNPRWRRAMGTSAVISGIVTAGLLTSLWVYDKLQIRRVDPPSNATIVVQMMEEEMSPSAPPPPLAKKGGGDEPEEPEPEPEEPKPEPPVPDEEVPLEQPELDEQPVKARVRPTKRKTSSSDAPPGPGKPEGHEQGSVLGKRTAGPLAFGPGGPGRGLPGFGQGKAIATKTVAKKESVAKQPLAKVKSNSLYAPDCDAKKLAGTKASTFDKRPGSTTVGFCVSTSGQAVDVKTTKKFPGDPQVDRICRDTVKKWRFKPFKVGGKTIKTCSSVTFRIEFD